MGMRMRLKHFPWLILPACLGVFLVLTKVWISSSQASRVVLNYERSPGGIVRYVSWQGKDMGNDCATARQPCKSIPHAMQKAEVGDYIHVAGGTKSDTTYDDELTYG